MMLYLALKYLHVIGAAVLLGTGAGIAFFMLRAHVTGEAAVIAAVARIVVLADFLFTATAVIAQPITGIALAQLAGYSLSESWIWPRSACTFSPEHSGFPSSGSSSKCVTLLAQRRAKASRFPLAIIAFSASGSRSAFPLSPLCWLFSG